MIACQRDGAVWTARITRPDKANSLTRDMLETLAGFAEDAAGAAQVLILTGEGRVFSAGADLEQAREGLATDPVWERLSGAVAAFPGLSIAALNGTLAGGAFGMALACDLRIAVPSARFFYPVMKLGFLPQPSDPGRLVTLVGPARARLILMAGARLDAPEALAFGLIDRITEDLETTLAELTADAAAADPAHVAAIKRMTC
ncbi:enoyl-CoA hydratase/isomerase family protein [Anianabacter salinae]|uniref:enoyl-CoA hydratase/isomerase family protein n=1 Tax=Anianabacter salinae TaxID=2851023 RepID=UPI00225E068E|nr:enoyl-CoA hydratase/isomerase family protein [Anianabacter salinae]MBV0913654.1 enoyl-CoA hydratase/isomerase family protein [Anianabacter salinae]